MLSLGFEPDKELLELSVFLLHTSESVSSVPWVLRLPKVSLTVQNIEEGFPADGGPRAVSQDVEGEELPGRQGLHQRQPGHHRHQGREEPRLQGGQIRELFLFLD